MVDALIALLPPLIFRAIIDTAIPAGNRRQIWLLAGLAVGVALGDAGLAIVQRWYSARIGEGLIYELRVALFDKVQRMPVAFFTRTQTGALISRLNNDVVGAQTAVTSTLGSVVSNVIVLVTTLTAMLVLEWQLTMLTLIVLPLFILPAKRIGRKLATIAREQMNLNAQTQHADDRAVQRGRRHAREAVRPVRRRASRLRRRARPRCATRASARPCTAGSSSSPWGSSPPSVPR